MVMVIIDVREPYEFQAGHVKGALNIPLSSISESKQLEGVEKDEELVVYCRSGSRSGLAIEMLKLLGFTNLTNGINQAAVESRQ